MRENADAKGRRYLTEGRIRVLHADEDGIAAEARGDGALYVVGYDDRGWHCSCPAYGRCAHLIAIGLIFVAEPRK